MRGLTQSTSRTSTYLCKLDLDLDLPPRYFERLMERMKADPRIGTTSGKPYIVDARTGQHVPELCGDEMSVGMTKFYRTACFDEIGGFVREVMWDGIDCHRRRMLGWIAGAGTKPSCASSTCARWDRARRASGPAACARVSASISWARRLYLTASAVYRMPQPPYSSAGCDVWGYVAPGPGAAAARRCRAAAFIRAYQRRALLVGKARATAEVVARQERVWRAREGRGVTAPAAIRAALAEHGAR